AQGGVWTEYDLPACAIPVLNQGVKGGTIAVPRLSPGPDIVRSECCCTHQNVLRRAGIRAGDNTPLRAVPVFGPCLRGKTGLVSARSNSPDIIRRDHRYTVEEALNTKAGIGTFDDAPGSTACWSSGIQ